MNDIITILSLQKCELTQGAPFGPRIEIGVVCALKLVRPSEGSQEVSSKKIPARGKVGEFSCSFENNLKVLGLPLDFNGQPCIAYLDSYCDGKIVDTDILHNWDCCVIRGGDSISCGPGNFVRITKSVVG
jgi:hypothetical protein